MSSREERAKAKFDKDQRLIGRLADALDIEAMTGHDGYRSAPEAPKPKDDEK